MRVDLESISIYAFMNIAEEQMISFKKNCLYGIFGENKDTGSSNGAGKTTLINAINAGIFGLSATDLTTKDARNRILDVPPRIKITLSVGKDQFIIDRVIGGKLRTKLNDEDWKEGSVDDMQNHINQTIGLTPEQAIHLSFKRQGDFGGFLLMKDSEKKEFLGSFMNLEKIENAEKSFKAKLESLAKEKLQLGFSVSSLVDKIEFNNKLLQPAVKSLEDLSSPQMSARIVALRNETSAIELNVQNLKNNLSMVDSSEEAKKIIEESNQAAAKLEADRSLSLSKIPDLQAKEAALNSQIASFMPNLTLLKQKKDNAQKAIKKYKEMEADLFGVQKKISDMEKELLSLEVDLSKLNSELLSLNEKEETHNEKCYTCNRALDWDSKNAVKGTIQRDRDLINSKIDKNKKRADLIKSDLESIRASESNLLLLVKPENLTALQSALSEAEAGILSMEQGGLSTLSSSLASIKDHISSLNTQIGYTNNAIKMVKESAESKIKDIKKDISIKISELESQKVRNLNEIEKYDASLASAKKNIAEFSSQNDQMTKELESLSDRLNALASEEVIIGKILHILSRQGFVGYLFDSMLEEINNEVNRNLKSLPITSNFQLYFSPDKVTKSSGNMSKNITYEIISSGSPTSFEALSGAEKLSVILSVEEAIDTVVSKRSGITIGWKFLDEQLMFVDSGNKEFVMDFLKERSANKTYFVVDHASEFNAAIENRIKVVKENGMANIISE